MKLKVLLTIFAVAFYATDARPTLDLLLQAAHEIGKELIPHNENYDGGYRSHKTVYEPPPGYYPYPNGPYPGGAPYPSPYQQGPYSPYPVDPRAPHYPGTYIPARPAPNRPYPSTNYIQGPPSPYEERYPSQYESNSYGAASGTNSYSYGRTSGYKQRGY